MEKEHSNIFDAAKKIAEKGTQKSSFPSRPSLASKPKSPAKPTPRPEPVKPAAPVAKEPVLDPETEKIFEQMFKMRDELQNRLGDFYEKTGFSASEVEKFFNNPNNFTQEKWAKIQRDRSELEKKIYNVLGVEVKLQKQKVEKEQTSKERKAKSLGMRKNWIPIR